MNLGIDLGTSRTVIYAPGEGILLDEPSVIAVSKRDGSVIACGEEAGEMLGRTPPSILAIQPIRKGVIAEYDMAEKMLRHFIRKVYANRITKPCAAVSVAESMTEVERRSFIEAVISAGARRVTLVPETVAAAIGAGLDVSLPCGRMVVNIGGGTTDVSVLTLRGEAVSVSVRTAGDAMDEAIVRSIRAVYGLIISPTMAEQVKIAVGSAVVPQEEMTTVVKGRDSLTGLPVSRSVTAAEIHEAMEESLLLILDAVRRALEITPPELIGDVLGNGICLTGGMARLRGLPERICRETGIACRPAEEPSHCVAIGAGTALQYASSFSEVYDLSGFQYHLSDTVTD